MDSRSRYSKSPRKDRKLLLGGLILLALLLLMSLFFFREDKPGPLVNKSEDEKLPTESDPFNSLPILNPDSKVAVLNRRVRRRSHKVVIPERPGIFPGPGELEDVCKGRIYKITLRERGMYRGCLIGDGKFLTLHTQKGKFQVQNELLQEEEITFKGRNEQAIRPTGEYKPELPDVKVKVKEVKRPAAVEQGKICIIPNLTK